MHVHAGTSGFSFDEWQGKFYPPELRADARLGYYSARLETVEINNSFYQMPKPALLERWRDIVPEGFRFALKAPRRITHVQKLSGVADSLERFLSAAAVLGEKLGPVLFQLPPFVRRDTKLLADFLALVPPAQLVAFEFRHVSWFDDEVFSLLAARNVALCGGDADKGELSPPLVATASFGYLRLRAAGYDEAELRTWADRIKAQPWTDAFAFLKHEVLGPSYAQMLAALTAGKPAPALASAAKTKTKTKPPPKRKSKVTPTRGRFVSE